MECRICGTIADEVFSERVLRKYDASYFLCPMCGFHFTDSSKWNEEAYAEAINMRDYGILDRNIRNLRNVFVYLYKNHEFRIKKIFPRVWYRVTREADCVDYGGGYGILTRLLRDAGINAYWTDKYAQNLFAKGYEAEKRKYRYMTMFEVMEHVSDPVDEMKIAIEDYHPETIFFSTVLYGNSGELPTRDWWYYIFDMGQHVSFYSARTLDIIAEKLGYRFYSNGKDFHCFSRNPSFKRIMKTWQWRIRKIFENISERTESLLRYDEKFMDEFCKGGVNVKVTTKSGTLE